MIVVTENAGMFGPFVEAVMMEDRVRCDGADIPFTVVGSCRVLDIEIPDGYQLDRCDLVDDELVPKEPISLDK